MTGRRTFDPRFEQRDARCLRERRKKNDVFIHVNDSLKLGTAAVLGYFYARAFLFTRVREKKNDTPRRRRRRRVGLFRVVRFRTRGS